MLFDIFFSPTKVLNALMLIIHAFLLLIADLQNHVIYVQGRPIYQNYCRNVHDVD